jgi:hypothetical protein
MIVNFYRSCPNVIVVQFVQPKYKGSFPLISKTRCECLSQAAQSCKGQYRLIVIVMYIIVMYILVKICHKYKFKNEIDLPI